MLQVLPVIVDGKKDESYAEVDKLITTEMPFCKPIQKFENSITQKESFITEDQSLQFNKNNDEGFNFGEYYRLSYQFDDIYGFNCANESKEHLY